MNAPLKEWLNQTIVELEEERDATPGTVNEDVANALAAMWLALASLEADVVAWTDEQELRDVEKYGCGYLFTANPVTPNADPHRVIKLYTASPAPMLPEEMPKGLAGQIVSLLAHNIGDKFLAQKIWNACRATMLHGAEPVTTANKLGSSPEIPDGYVLVPKEPTEEMLRASYHEASVYSAKAYRAMLAAAPQQEV
ncbi:hypothetical protein V1599_12235 [Enterobacter sp. ECC-175]